MSIKKRKRLKMCPRIHAKISETPRTVEEARSPAGGLVPCYKLQLEVKPLRAVKRSHHGSVTLETTRCAPGPLRQRTRDARCTRVRELGIDMVEVTEFLGIVLAMSSVQKRLRGL